MSKVHQPTNGAYTDQSSSDIMKAMEACRRAVLAGAERCMLYYSTGVSVDTKADRSPVTIADKESEAVIVEVIHSTFPQDAILTEESGLLGEITSRRWIVDPLDGTRGFTRGGSFWGPLVACEIQGTIVAGAMCLPVLQQTFWAGKGLGSYKNGQRLRVSTQTDWTQSTLSLGEIGRMLEMPQTPGILRLVASAASARCFGDLAAVAMVLEGKADAWIEANVKPWDLAPHKILLEEAGGMFTDFHGQLTIETGNAIGSNGVLHSFLQAQMLA